MSGKPPVAFSSYIVLIIFAHFTFKTTGVVIVNDKGKPVVTETFQRCENVIHIMEDEDDPAASEQKFDIAWNPNATECSMLIQGDDNCAVSLSCSINIPTKTNETNKCGREFVRITDGAYGFKIFCGTTKFKDLRASSNLRDLFVKMEIGVKKPRKHGIQKAVKHKKAMKKAVKLMESRDEAQYEGISCVARCVKKRDEPGGTRLPKNMEMRKNTKCVCGLHNNKDDRIINGEDVFLNEIPWQAAVVAPNTRKPSCGASIINDQYILTAAHCFWFKQKKPEEIEVLVHANVLDQAKRKGATDEVALGKEGSLQSRGYNLSKTTDEMERTQRFKVAEIINSPLFDEDFDYDFALLRLETKINFENPEAPVTPVCLPPVETWNTLMKSWDGKMMQVSGWGLGDEKAGGTTRLLQKLDVPYLPFKDCIPMIQKYELSSRMLCAGFTEKGVNKDSCTGDSGGPLTVKSPDNPKVSWQVGVVSFGERCGMAKPGVYSRVTDAMQWILFHTEQAEAPSVWCAEPVE